MPVYTRSKSTPEEDTDPTDTDIDNKMAASKPPLTLDDIFAEIKQGNATTNEKLAKLETKIDSNQKLIKDYIKNNDAALSKVKNKVDKLENSQKSTSDTVKGLESRLTLVTDELQELQKNTNKQKKMLDLLHKKDKEQEVDKKRSNIIIEGLQEV